ncbi:MAG: hypothetical protein R2849_14540 [Thermomicrobiales bacterium]
MPVCPIHDVIIEGTDLIAATHGRSFWILDDLSPLYQLSDEITGEPAHLFEPRETTRYKMYGRMVDFHNPKPDMNFLMAGPVTVGLEMLESPSGVYKPKFLDAGQNPPEGVIFHYWLGSNPAEDITLTIADEAGNEVASYSSATDTVPHLPAAAGMNRFVWNYRYNQPVTLEDGDSLPENLLPKAVPGTYQATLAVGGSEHTQSVSVLPDPRLPWSGRTLSSSAI